VALRPPVARLRAGAAILVLWLGAKLIGPALIVSTDLSTEAKALLSGLLFFGVSKLCLVAVIMVLGKPGFLYLKTQIFSALARAFARIARPHAVGRLRYRIGLAMFFLPLLLGWVIPILQRVSPYLDQLGRPFEWVWDIVFIASFFVLGGEFWDKLRALFVYGAKAKFPERPIQA
jgi:hypothetical protein